MARREHLSATSSAGDTWAGYACTPSALLRERIPHYRAFSANLQQPRERLEVTRGAVVMVIGLGEALRMHEAGTRGSAAFYDSFVVAPDHRPLVAEHRGRRACIEIALAPWAARELLGEAVLELDGRPVPLDALLGAEGARLAHRLAATDVWMVRFALVDRFLAERAAQARRQVPAQIRWAWAQLERSAGAVPVGSLSRALGWSHRHFVARFRACTGLTPKAAARRLRLARALALLRGDPRTDLGALAAQCEYADQSHFTRECHELAGVTPDAYRRHLLAEPAAPGEGGAAAPAEGGAAARGESGASAPGGSGAPAPGGSCALAPAQRT